MVEINPNVTVPSSFYSEKASNVTFEELFEMLDMTILADIGVKYFGTGVEDDKQES